jgi:hypothetical protein
MSTVTSLNAGNVPSVVGNTIKFPSGTTITIPTGLVQGTPEFTLWLDQQTQTDAQNRDSLTMITDYIKQWGIDPSLGEWAWKQITSGKSQAEVALGLQDQPAYINRFGKVIDAYKAKNLTPPQPAEILNYEQQFYQTMRAANMPKDFYDSPDDAQNFMSRQWSLNEVVSAVNDGYLKVKNAPIEVRKAFQSFFGADGDSALASFFLDPEKAQPILERAVSEAQIGGQALRFGFNIDKTQAERFTDLGITQDTASQNFQQLQELNPLFTASVSEKDNLDAQVQGIQAFFEGNTAAKQAMTQRQNQRKSDVAGGGGAMGGQAGILGLGTAK